MTVTVRVLREANLLKKLRRLPDETRKQIEAAMAKEADLIVAQMKRIAPADTGDLRDSIAWRWGDAPGGTMKLGTVTPGGGLTITIYAGGGQEFYARFVEFGTVNMAARPFFYPVWRARRKRARRVIGNAVRKAARKVAAS